jgi:hypothetical protein
LSEAGIPALHHGANVALSLAKEVRKMNRLNDESGRVGYLVLYMMGVPIGLLLLMWVVLGNNIFGPG